MTPAHWVLELALKASDSKESRYHIRQAMKHEVIADQEVEA